MPSPNRIPQKPYEVYESDIDLWLDQFRAENGIDDLSKVTQSQWNAALMYVNKHCMQELGATLPGSRKKLYDDPVLLNAICDRYIYLCNMYSKEISMRGYAKLTGIYPETLEAWYNQSYRNINSNIYIDNIKGNTNIDIDTNNSANTNNGIDKDSLYHILCKKLNKEREESLSNKLADGMKNPVGVLAILNRHYAWNMPGVREEKRPELRSVEQIAAEMGVQLLPDSERPGEIILPEANF